LPEAIHDQELVFEEKRLRNDGTDAARTEQPSQDGNEMDEKNGQIAHRRMVAGRGILRNLGRNNNSPATGGKCMLFVDGNQVAQGYIPKTVPFAFSGDEGADVGLDAETAVSDDYKQEDNKFTGTIVRVTIDISPSGLSAADQKAVDDAEDAAVTAED
jgi:hypothetical protein